MSAPDRSTAALPAPGMARPPAPAPADTPVTTTHGDTALSALLSRLAALSGEAVGTVALSNTQSGRDGAEVATLSRPQRACEIWLAVFPAGSAAPLRAKPAAHDLPLVWLATEGEQALLLTGLLASGDFQAVNAQGMAQHLKAVDAAAGTTLALRVAAQGQGEDEERPTTARGWFRHALIRRRGIFIEAAMATMFINLLALGSSMYAMNIYDRVVPSRTSGTLWVMSIGVLMAYGFDFVLRHVRGRFVEAACREIDNELSSVFFDKMLSIRMDKRPQTVGTFASQLRQFESVRNFLTSTTMFVMADAPFSLIFVAVIAVIAGPIAIIPLLLLPLTVLASLLSKRKFERLAATRVRESNQRNGLLVEVISGIESVKAAQGGWKFSRRWNTLNASLSDNDLAARHHGQTLMHTVQMIQQLLNVGIIIAGVYAIHDGLLTTGALVACTIIGGRALAPAAGLTAIVAQWQGAKASLAVLEAIMALPSDGQGAGRPIIPEQCSSELALQAATFSYVPGGQETLNVPRLAFHPGERVMVMGASGSGKSTLLKLMSGLYAPDAGRVSLDNIDMAHLAPGYLREQIGYLPQDVWLFEGSLRDNITIGLPSPSDDQILRAAALTGLSQVIQAHPMGLGLPISEGGRGLSAGQRQLVGLTRLLIAQPPVVLLDEPTAAMDARLENHVVQQLVRHLDSRSLLVMVTHKAELLRHATRVLIVDGGKVLVDGPRDQVLAGLRDRLAAQTAAAAIDA
jgi:ATP-binding cassette subfamily C protein LapB